MKIVRKDEIAQVSASRIKCRSGVRLKAEVELHVRASCRRGLDTPSGFDLWLDIIDFSKFLDDDHPKGPPTLTLEIEGGFPWGQVPDGAIHTSFIKEVGEAVDSGISVLLANKARIELIPIQTGPEDEVEFVFRIGTFVATVRRSYEQLVQWFDFGEVK